MLFQNLCITMSWLVFGLTPMQGTQEQLRPSGLETTIKLYFESDPDYQAGDLLTRSMLAEFQAYLQRTQGHSLATNPKWQKRVLADRAPLSRLYYSGNETVLRKAALKLGSYRELERLSRKSQGRRILQQSIDNNAVNHLIEAVGANVRSATDAELEKTTAVKEVNSGQALRVNSDRIYTASDFLAALRAYQEAQKKPKASETADRLKTS